MVNTIGELIERIQNAYSKGVQSDDSRLSSRHIYSKLKSVRNKIISQQLKKRQKISDWNFIILPCTELIKVENHECPCLPSIGCQVYRTKHKLPKVLTDLNKHIIQWVMTVESSKIIDEITRESYLYNAGNKYTSKHLKYILENEYLYIYGENIPQLIKIKLLAEDPIEAYNFPSYCGNDSNNNECESMFDKVFPIDGDMIELLIEMSFPELITIFNQSTEDKLNDSTDSNDKNRQ